MVTFIAISIHSLPQQITFPQEDEMDVLPIGRLSRQSAVMRREGDLGIVMRKLVMGKLT